MSQITSIEDLSGPLKKIRKENHVDIEKLEKGVFDLSKMNITSKEQLQKGVNSIRRKYKISPSNIQMLETYRKLCDDGKLEFDPSFEPLLQSNEVRGLSGVNVIAVTLSPYPFTKSDQSDKQSFSCQWNCKFCPSKPGFPRSYVDGEPGVDRGYQNDYDPVAQITDRLTTYVKTGHAADKIELIVLGGTWASYPIFYQYWFITNLYYGANTFYDNEKREMLDIEDEIRINETSKVRIIGLTLETRPDCVNIKEIIKFRRMGVTRVQIGMQHINERVLGRIDRRCKTNTVINAIKMLKDNCFKVDIHIMPDLPKPVLRGYDDSDIVFTQEELEEYRRLKRFENPSETNSKRLREINSRIEELKSMIDWDFDMFDEDKKMIDVVVNSPEYQADQWKLYPLQVMPWSPLEPENEIGLHESYINNHTPNGNQLIDVLLYAQQSVPKWIRINRVVRDIPTKYVRGGCDCGNLQQYLINIMKKQGKTCKCIRCREVKNKTIDHENAKLCVTKYSASEGDEYFISFEDPTETILYGFLRLRLSENSGMGDKGIVFDELRGTALIRELHVYGQTIAVNKESKTSSSQHVGFGSKLLKKAEEIAMDNGHKKIAVISGVGVKEYYRKRGYDDGSFFLIKNLNKNTNDEEKKSPGFFSKIFRMIA